MCKEIDPAELADQTRLGQVLSALEHNPASAHELLASLPTPPLPTHRVGVTGSPGVGKSTLLAELIKLYRSRGHRVGVVAVDPTSPLTGGAILADRLRLGDTQSDPGVFIRSLGSRGSLGGVTPAASAVASVLEAAGYSRILIETVGVGQTGYDVINLADTVIALFSPESGDGVQLLKAGILEVGDVFAVNKSDRPGADLLLKEIRGSLELNVISASARIHHGIGFEDGASDAQATNDGEWTQPVISLSALKNQGVADVLEAVEAHREWLAALPPDHPRRRWRVARELAFVLRSRLSQMLEETLSSAVDRLAARVHAGELEMWNAVDQLRNLLRETF
jgi:LAO/AO transport system kinase